MSTEQPTTTRSWFQGSRAAVAALVATIAVITAIVLATSDSDSDAAADRSPGAVLFAFQDAYNAGDVDGILDQFAPEAAITRYPNLITNATGTDQIEALFTSETDDGAQYQFSEVEVEGSTVTFRHRWTAEACTTAQGHRMVVENGLIQSWEWPTTNARC